MQPLRWLGAAALAALSFTAHAVGSLAQVTVYDRVSREALPVHWHDGSAYVVGKPGNEYQVTVRNRTGEDLLAVVSVDGVNVMSGETANARQSGYVVARGDRVEIRGWRKSLGEIAAFYFTSLGDSYAARTSRPGNVGVIGVALFKRRPAEVALFSDGGPSRDREPQENSRFVPQGPVSPLPPAAASPRAESTDRAAPSRSYADAAPPLGTGHGRQESSPVRWVDFERLSSVPDETIILRYDSYRSLAARGIIEAPPAPREPKAFPGFVPDPPPSAYF